MAVSHVPQQHLTSAFVNALGSLTSLTWLWFSQASARTALPAGFVATLGRLTRLQTLRLAHAGLHAASLPLLPASLTELCSVWLPAKHAAGSAADIALIHIRRLRHFKLNVPAGLSTASQLPAGLHQLTLMGPAEAVGGLQQLRWLELTQPQHALPLLARLRELPQLQGLKAKLGDCQPDEVGAVVAAIAAATRLTRLQLYSTDASQEEDEDNVIDCAGQMLHRHLRQLRKLRVLHLSAFGFDRANAVHFTALSSTLTDLKLSFCHISDLAVAAMLQRLTGLRRLN